MRPCTTLSQERMGMCQLHALSLSRQDEAISCSPCRITEREHRGVPGSEETPPVNPAFMRYFDIDSRWVTDSANKYEDISKTWSALYARFLTDLLKLGLFYKHLCISVSESSFPPYHKNIITLKLLEILKFWDNVHHPLCVTCHRSHVMCHGFN